MSNNTTASNTSRTFQPGGLCQLLTTSCKQLTKTSGSEDPASEYHQQLCCCSSIRHLYQFTATMSLYDDILTHGLTNMLTYDGRMLVITEYCQNHCIGFACFIVCGRRSNGTTHKHDASSNLEKNAMLWPKDEYQRREENGLFPK